MNSVAHKSPIVEGIVEIILENFDSNLNQKEKFQLNTDIIPRFRQPRKFEKKLDRQESILHTQPLRIIPQKIQRLIKPMQSQRIIQQKVFTPKQTNEPDPRRVYMKILPLLKDPFVTHIECSGPGIPVEITSSNDNLKKRTRIMLQKEEIKEFLKYAADQARIPLIEGVFKAMVDDYYISAVFSDVTDPRFMIKKEFKSYEFI